MGSWAEYQVEMRDPDGSWGSRGFAGPGPYRDEHEARGGRYRAAQVTPERDFRTAIRTGLAAATGWIALDEVPAGRRPVARIADDAPDPGQAVYMVTPDDVGLDRIRLVIGVTVRVADIENAATRLPWGAETIAAEHAGRWLYGMPNKGWSGPPWYWEVRP